MDSNLSESTTWLDANLFQTNQLENPGQPSQYANETAEGQSSRYANETTEDLIMKLRSFVQELAVGHSNRAMCFDISNSIAKRREELKSKYASLLSCGYIPPFGELSRIEFINWNMDILFIFMKMAYERNLNIACLVLSMEIPKISLYQQLQNSSDECSFIRCYNAMNVNRNQEETSGVQDNELQPSDDTLKRESGRATPSEHRNTTRDDSELNCGDSLAGSCTYQEEESDKSWLIEHEEEVITDCNGRLDEQLDLPVGQFATRSSENSRNSLDKMSKVVVVRPFKWLDPQCPEDDSEILKKHVINE
ncbi:hypothetical protein ANCCAN_08099 [Ancylostoma caninum]|uniref:Uncharacterized protein n=1 Tax=Ancylostoma caninum TaxID=29170 RepID=A0A368GNN2_ANCCA|nr:hypothetical protein ANCCAN_08099 [Ancylostoma caninum]